MMTCVEKLIRLNKLWGMVVRELAQIVGHVRFDRRNDKQSGLQRLNKYDSSR